MGVTFYKHFQKIGLRPAFPPPSFFIISTPTKKHRSIGQTNNKSFSEEKLQKKAEDEDEDEDRDDDDRSNGNNNKPKTGSQSHAPTIFFH